ncbi:hypothetical protein MMC18_002618 [Xylographa bjoerkii]|nr:hypothetical protein [Xylographa bjoerkii]
MDFPTDPSLPSVRNVASNQLPLCIPWTPGAGFLGNGFTSTAAASHDPFAVSIAFAPGALARCRLEFGTANGLPGGDYTRTSTSDAQRSTEHMDFTLSASIGCDFLGASGSGTYVKNVLGNQDADKFSIRSTVRAGIVAFAPASAPLSLSSSAKAVLTAQYTDGSDPLKHFFNEFGDYYVAGFVIGAKNIGLLSMDVESTSEEWSLVVKITLKILWFKHTWEIDRSGGSQSSTGRLTFEGYDSLAGKNDSRKASDETTAEAMYQVALQYEKWGESLRARVEDQLVALQLDSNKPNQRLTYTQCHKIHQSGLVVEILLLPFAGLRDFVQTMN